MEFTLLGAAFVGVIALYGVLYWEARRGNAVACSRNLWDVAITAAMVGLVVGRLAAMVQASVNPLTNLADIIIVRGGVATGPAAAAALATAAWIGRNELWPVVDGLSAGAVAGLAGWHAGCVVRDSCLGTPSDLPWALAQDGSAVTRHPVEIYAAIILGLTAVFLALWRARGRPRPGTPAGLALAMSGVARIVTEPLRPSLGTGPVWWYAAAIVAGVALSAYAARGTVRSTRE